MKIAILGTRRPSPYGKWASYGLAKSIVQQGGTVLSTTMNGISYEALNGAMSVDRRKAIGYTLANEGCIYPYSTADVQGVLMKYGNLNHAKYDEFPGQRVINMYEQLADDCDAMIIVEGTLKSGTELIASLALSKDKKLYAVPGNINQPGSKLPNKLIAEGATPIESIEDLGLLNDEKEK